MSCVETLRRRRLKLTPQRRLIVETIHAAGGHVTPEDIIARVQDKMPGINKSTVYRTLDLLEEAGCVVKSELASQTVYHHAEEGHHHHLMCVKCGRSTDYDEDLFATVATLLTDRVGFYADFTHTVVRGICGRCRAGNDREAHPNSALRTAKESSARASTNPGE